jgi:hypothetical protein
MKGKKKISFIASVVNVEFFGLILLGGFLITWIEPKVTVSEFEKRELTSFPTFSFVKLFEGNYTDSLDMYYSDHFAHRDQWVELTAGIKGLFGFRSHDLMVYESENPEFARIDSLQMADSLNHARRDSLRANRKIKKDPNGLPPEKKNSILIYNGMAFQLFGRYKEAEKNFANTINRYHDRLGDTCRVFACLVPSPIDFYLPEDYKSKSNYEKPSIDTIYSKLVSEIHKVDAYGFLEDAIDDFIYFKTDHHWTARGAYQAYLAFCRSAGLSAASLKSFERYVRKPFLGSLYYATLDTRLRNSGDSLEYFMPPTAAQAWRYPEKDLKKIVPTDLVNKRLGQGGSYLVFIGGDYPLTHIITSNKNGKKIFMIKDSYGNALVPFLTSHYEEIFVADYRSFDSNVIRFIMQENIDDLLFLHNIAVANTKYSASRESYLMRTRDLAPLVTRDTTSVVE